LLRSWLLHLALLLLLLHLLQHEVLILCPRLLLLQHLLLHLRRLLLLHVRLHLRHVARAWRVCWRHCLYTLLRKIAPAPRTVLHLKATVHRLILLLPPGLHLVAEHVLHVTILLQFVFQLRLSLLLLLLILHLKLLLQLLAWILLQLALLLLVILRW